MTVHAGDSPERSVAAYPGRPGHRTVESKLLASIVDSSDDAIFSKTLDGVITSWNKAAERIYGYQAEEIIGQPVSLLIPPDRPNEMVEILDRIRLGERVGPYETTRRRKDGTIIAISLTVSPIHDAASGVVGASTIARDITERERVRDQASAASQYSRSLIEASLDPLVTISAEGKITDVNEATVRVTGVERGHLVGTDFSDYFTEPDRAREGYRQVFAQGFVTDYPLTIRHTGGDLTEVLYNASVYKDAGRQGARRGRHRPRRHRFETTVCERLRKPRRSWTTSCRAPRSTRSSGWTSTTVFFRGTRERAATTAIRRKRS